MVEAVGYVWVCLAHCVRVHLMHIGKRKRKKEDENHRHVGVWISVDTQNQCFTPNLGPIAVLTAMCVYEHEHYGLTSGYALEAWALCLNIRGLWFCMSQRSGNI